MKKTFAAFVAVATIAGSLAATPASAQRGVAAGVAAGLHRRRDHRWRDRLQPPGLWWPGVCGRALPPCRLVRERFWDGYGWRFRRVEVCN